MTEPTPQTIEPAAQSEPPTDALAPAAAAPTQAPIMAALSAPARFDFLHDVPLEVTVELGSRRMPLEAILNLGPGATIELDKANGEPLDIKVNGVLIARGEAVIVNERFGVRIVSVLHQQAEESAS